MSTIGVSDFSYAILKTDDTTGATYGTFTAVPGLNAIDVNPASNSAVNYGDNGAVESATCLGEIKVDVTTTDLPLQAQADLLGHTIDKDGQMVCKSSDVVPYVAICFKGLKSNGKLRGVKLFKGRFAEFSDTYKTQEDKPAFQNPKLSGAFVCRTYDKQWKAILDEDATGATAETFGAFFKTV